MTPQSFHGIEAYLARLNAELRRRLIVHPRLLEETRGHLRDAVEQGVREGLTEAEAEARALQNFGSPETVARTVSREEFVMINRIVTVVSIAIGVAIAYIDSRPHFDDAGITAGLMVISAGLLAMIAPQRPWLWALAIGICIPAHAMVQHPGLKSLTMVVLLAFPLAGAYAGMAMRRALSGA